MSAADVIIIVIIAAIFVCAVTCWRKRKKKSSPCGCSMNCSNCTACPSGKADDDE